MNDLLKYDEALIFKLRKLYRQYGYTPFKMSKFEPYDLYADKKDFLVSDGVITFTDTDGSLLALKPDVTLSIIKNYRNAPETLQKTYYNETVYRSEGSGQGYREIMQTGLECIGQVDHTAVSEVLQLAIRSLREISEDYMLDVNHVELPEQIVSPLDLTPAQKSSIFSCLSEKNEDALLALPFRIPDDILLQLQTLIRSYGPLDKVLAEAKCLQKLDAYHELQALSNTLRDLGIADRVYLDFSISGSGNYYNGLVFRGYIANIPAPVLSGGRYDRLVRKMGKSAGGIGFAVYLNELERMQTNIPDCDQEQSSVSNPKQSQIVNIALPKGRLGEKVYAMFEAAGFSCPEIHAPGRKLIFENEETGVCFFWVKPSDVAIYVERGAADIGVAGKDILLEYAPQIYELLDMNMGKCRMAVAAKSDFCDNRDKTLRVATKFPNIAKQYYASQCREIDIIKLNGSIELAPLLDLSDVIVDIVETGATLKENDLIPFETIVPISARLISNKVSHKFKHDQIQTILDALKQQVKSND